ncbi:hypothetical protein D3C85_1827590 [compost metagenome]
MVTSAVSSLPEVGGDSVLYCNPYEIESIAQAIEDIITNQSKRSELVAAGIARSKLFTYKEAAEKTHNLFKQIL